jgi:hypothetical protein
MSVAGGGGEKDKSHWIAKAALAVSVFSLLITLYRTSPVGSVEPVMPLTSYALVRGIDPEGTFGPYPSDHIVLPMEFSNNTGSTVLLKAPRLELDETSTPENENVTFFLTGEYKELSPELLDDVNSQPHTFTPDLVLSPHSVSERNLVFRVSEWTQDDKNYCFRFHQGQRFEIDLKYERIPQNPVTAWLWRVLPGDGPEHTVRLDPVLPILEGINKYPLYTADYISLLPGSRAVNPDGTHKDIPKVPMGNETSENLCPG